jgi:Fe2+ transport system protein B
VPIVETSASKKLGVDKLLQVTVESIGKKAKPLDISYGKEIDEEIKTLKACLKTRISLILRDGWL